jgi:sugar/nucleoside kinase (ribokinase family)
VDTLGAGDFFHGAFCRFLTRPALDFPGQLAAAAQVAALRCARLGPRNWLNDLRTAGPAMRQAARQDERAT